MKILLWSNLRRCDAAVITARDRIRHCVDQIGIRTATFAIWILRIGWITRAFARFAMAHASVALIRPPMVTCVCENCPFNRVRCFATSSPNRPITCSNIDRPVCGTNRVTYRNACQLVFRTACFGYPVRVCHSGPCRRDQDEDEEAGIVDIDE